MPTLLPPPSTESTGTLTPKPIFRAAHGRAARRDRQEPASFIRTCFDSVVCNVLTAQLSERLDGTRPSAYLRHVEIGTVSLQASSRCVRVSEADKIVLTIVPVQPRTCTVATFYVNHRGRSVAPLSTDWYPEYVSDHFQNFTNPSPVNSLSILQIS